MVLLPAPGDQEARRVAARMSQAVASRPWSELAPGLEVRVTAEDLTTGAVTHTNAAHLVYVALGEDGRPAPVPPVRCETAAEQERARAAAERRQARLIARVSGHER